MKKRVKIEQTLSFPGSEGSSDFATTLYCKIDAPPKTGKAKKAGALKGPCSDGQNGVPVMIQRPKFNALAMGSYESFKIADKSDEEWARMFESLKKCPEAKARCLECLAKARVAAMKGA